MKKGTSYIVVAAMVMGLILTGCGGSDNSDTTAASATTESVTEVATEEQDTEIQDTADDTEDSSVAIDEEDTAEDTEDSEEAEADPSIVGVYTRMVMRIRILDLRSTLKEAMEFRQEVHYCLLPISLRLWRIPIAMRLCRGHWIIWIIALR